MPTYEYVCEKCGHQFEKIQPISAKSLEVCPEDLCGQKRWGKGKVKRAISAGAGLLFKGSVSTSPIIGAKNTKRRPRKIRPGKLLNQRQQNFEIRYQASCENFGNEIE